MTGSSLEQQTSVEPQATSEATREGILHFYLSVLSNLSPQMYADINRQWSAHIDPSKRTPLSPELVKAADAVHEYIRSIDHVEPTI